MEGISDMSRMFDTRKERMMVEGKEKESEEKNTPVATWSTCNPVNCNMWDKGKATFVVGTNYESK